MASLAGAFAGGIASGLGSSLFNKKAKAPPTIIPGLNAGGLTSSVSRLPGDVVQQNVTASPERMGLITGLQSALRSRAGQVRGLLPQVEAGFGRLTQAGMDTFGAARERLQNQRSRAVGNLRDNLARRRVLGSSFATDALARADNEFAQSERELATQEAQFKATSFLQELDLTHKLMGEAASFEIEAFNTALNELNLQANLAANLATGTATAIQNSANLQTQIMNANAQQTAQLWGFSMDPFIKQLETTVSGKVKEIFSGGG